LTETENIDYTKYANDKKIMLGIFEDGVYKVDIGIKKTYRDEIIALRANEITKLHSIPFEMTGFITSESFYQKGVSQINDKTISDPVPSDNEVFSIDSKESQSTDSSTLFSESSFGSVRINEVSENYANPIITISGKVENSKGGKVTITISKPNNIVDKLTTFVTQDGTYQLVLFENWEDGLYAVKVNYMENEVGSVHFAVNDGKAESMEQELFLEAIHAVELSETNTDASDLEQTLISLDAKIDWYHPQMLKISGTIDNLSKGAMIDITITRPDNSVVESKVHLTSDNTFEVPVLCLDRSQQGPYTITASYMGGEIVCCSSSCICVYIILIYCYR